MVTNHFSVWWLVVTRRGPPACSRSPSHALHVWFFSGLWRSCCLSTFLSNPDDNPVGTDIAFLLQWMSFSGYKANWQCLTSLPCPSHFKSWLWAEFLVLPTSISPQKQLLRANSCDSRDISNASFWKQVPQVLVPDRVQFVFGAEELPIPHSELIMQFNTSHSKWST